MLRQIHTRSMLHRDHGNVLIKLTFFALTFSFDARKQFFNTKLTKIEEFRLLRPHR